MSLLARAAAHKRAAVVGFAVVQSVVDDSDLVTASNFVFVERAVYAYAAATASESSVSIKALECLYRLHCRVRALLQLSNSDVGSDKARTVAWHEYCEFQFDHNIEF